MGLFRNRKKYHGFTDFEAESLLAKLVRSLKGRLNYFVPHLSFRPEWRKSNYSSLDMTKMGARSALELSS